MEEYSRRMRIKSTAHSTSAALSWRVGVALHKRPIRNAPPLWRMRKRSICFFQLLLGFSPTLLHDLAAAFSDLVDTMTPVALLVATVSLVALVIQYLSYRRQCLVGPIYHLHTPKSLNLQSQIKRLATATDVFQPPD